MIAGESGIEARVGVVIAAANAIIARGVVRDERIAAMNEIDAEFARRICERMLGHG